MLSTPALVRVSDMNSSPSSKRIARQYVISPPRPKSGWKLARALVRMSRRRTIRSMSDRGAAADRDERAEWVRLVIDELHRDYAPLADGEPADYIPELANV